MRTIRLFLLLAFGTLAAQAGWLHVLSIGVDVAGCVLSATDGWTTTKVIDAGGREANMIFAGSQKGGISWPKLITYKTIQCGSPFVLHQVYHHMGVSDRTADQSALGTGLVAVGTYTWATSHNENLANRLRVQSQSAANLR